MEAERFERLLEEARRYANVKPDILNIFQENARFKLRKLLDVLEAECSPAQWTRVLEEIEQGWQPSA